MRGPSTKVGSRLALLSPAKVRVSRYVKGDGPKLVRVVTGVVSTEVVNSEGIEPHAGERWLIYSSSTRIPYQTSVCDGSRRLK